MKTKDADQIAEAVLRKAANMQGENQKASQNSAVDRKLPIEVRIKKIENGFLLMENDYYQETLGGQTTHYVANLDELPAILKKVFK